jgi:CheY-like chemotaxis protein
LKNTLDLNPLKLKKLSILYVEDEDSIRKGIAQFLKRRFDTVHAAADGKEGLGIFREHNPDIVVTDIKMPVMDGLDMSRQIKEMSPDTPIIILTAFTEIPLLARAIEIGVDKYLHKPVINEDLLNSIYKSGLVFIQKKEIEEKNRIIQTVLDWHPCFSILVGEDNLDYINKAFLGFAGYETMGEFKAHHECISDFIAGIDGTTYEGTETEKWYGKIIENPEIDHIVYLKTKTNEKAMPYIVRFKHFEAIDQYLFAFICPEDIKKSE